MKQHQRRTPSGVPTGGQFATTEKAESDTDLIDVSDLGVYDDPEECAAIGVHLTAVDEDGYCNHCGHQSVGDERYGVSDAYPNGRCSACGCGVDESGRCYQSECSNFDETSPYAGYDEADSGAP